MKLVLDPKIKDVQFITKTSQPYNGVSSALASCNLSIQESLTYVPVFEKGL